MTVRAHGVQLHKQWPSTSSYCFSTAQMLLLLYTSCVKHQGYCITPSRKDMGLSNCSLLNLWYSQSISEKIRKVLNSTKLSAQFCQAINVHSGTQQVQGAVGVPEVNSNVLFRDVLKVCQVNTELRVARILQQHYTYMLWPVFRMTNFIHTSLYHQYGGWL